jgi:hypothetical protein
MRNIPQGLPRLSVCGPWLLAQDRNPVFLPWQPLIGHLHAKENPNTEDGAMKRGGFY